MFHYQSFGCQHFWSPPFLDVTYFSFIKSLVAKKHFLVAKVLVNANLFQLLQIFFASSTRLMKIS
jgi:hypothetical protein